MSLDVNLFGLAVGLIILSLFGSLTIRNSVGSSIVGICALPLAVCVAAYVLIPTAKGAISITAWAFFVFLPGFLGFLRTRYVRAERFRTAERLARFTRFVHPFAHTKGVADFLAAMRLASEGNLDNASALLERLATDPKLTIETRKSARLCALSLKGDWNEAVTQAEEIPGSVTLLPYHLRALGELGRVSEMLSVARNFPLAKGQKLPALAELFVFAFCGRVPAVEKTLAGPLSALASDSKRFWLATAKLVAVEDAASAREDLKRLAETPADAIRRGWAERRLSSPSALLVWTGSPEEIDLLDRWEAHPSKAPFGFVAILVTSVVFFLAMIQILVFGNEYIKNLIGAIALALCIAILLTRAGYWTMRSAARLMTGTRRHQAVHDILTRSTAQMRDPSKANRISMPSRGRRILVIAAYLAVSYFVLGLVVWFVGHFAGLLSRACLDSSSHCSSGDTFLMSGIGLAWLVSIVLCIGLGWRGRLLGARIRA
jgi:hypothetical protein